MYLGMCQKEEGCLLTCSSKSRYRYYQSLNLVMPVPPSPFFFLPFFLFFLLFFSPFLFPFSPSSHVGRCSIISCDNLRRTSIRTAHCDFLSLHRPALFDQAKDARSGCSICSRSTAPASFSIRPLTRNFVCCRAGLRVPHSSQQQVCWLS